MMGKTVFFDDEGSKCVRKVESWSGDGFRVKLAIPSEEGIPLVTDSVVNVAEDALEPFAGVAQNVQARRFDSVSVLENEDVKMTTVLDERKRIVDYLDVMFEGLTSTFEKLTPKDRQGDYVHRSGQDSPTAALWARHRISVAGKLSIYDTEEGS